MEGEGPSHYPKYVGFVLGMSCGAIVLTWLYNRSGGSILLVTVWHGIFNVVGGTAAATGVVAAVVSTLIMAPALFPVGMDLWARHTKQPSPLDAAPSHTEGFVPNAEAQALAEAARSPHTWG